jgi:hypothetical protein
MHLQSIRMEIGLSLPLHALCMSVSCVQGGVMPTSLRLMKEVEYLAFYVTVVDVAVTQPPLVTQPSRGSHRHGRIRRRGKRRTQQQETGRS